MFVPLFVLMVATFICGLGLQAIRDLKAYSSPTAKARIAQSVIVLGVIALALYVGALIGSLSR